MGVCSTHIARLDILWHGCMLAASTRRNFGELAIKVHDVSKAGGVVCGAVALANEQGMEERAGRLHRKHADRMRVPRKLAHDFIFVPFHVQRHVAVKQEGIR